MRLLSGKLADAQAELEKALTLDPKSESALHLLAYVYVSQKQPQKAIARVQQQIAAVPNDNSFYRELATLDLLVKDYNGARDAAQKALSIAPQDERAAQTLSQAYVSSGQVDAAITLWRQWSTQHPSDAVATSLLGELYDTKGDTDNAQTSYQKSLQIDPHQAWAANNLAYLLVEHNGNLDTALTLAQQARSGRSQDPNTADTLAWVYYHKGLYASARSLLEDSLKTSPENATIQYHLGLTFEKLGNKPDAVAHLKKAVEYGKNSSVGQRAAQELGTL